MRNRPLLAAALTGAAVAALAVPAAAQQQAPAPNGQLMGMRYLTWSGKPAASLPPLGGPARSDGLRRPGPPPMATAASGAAAARYSSIASGMNPAAPPPPAPRVVQPPPVRAARPPATMPPGMTAAPARPAPRVVAPPPVRMTAPPQPQPQPPQPRAGPPPTPAMASAPRPAPSPTLVPPGVYIPPANDPMAPRPDAPIFSIRSASPAPQPLPQPAPQAGQATPDLHPTQAGPPAAPYAGVSNQAPRDTARYYSVHRAAGRQPDATAMPVSVYLDHAPVDLAEPPPAPTVTRTVNGRAQVIAPNDEPSLP